jgi:hypothetical protein
MFSGNQAHKSFPLQLIGCWHLVFTEDPTIDPNMEIEFLNDGRLNYSIQTSDGWEIMHLTWYVEGEFIVTDQPSDPRVARTRFQIERDRTLVLTYGKYRSWYSEGSKRGPAV